MERAKTVADLMGRGDRPRGESLVAQYDPRSEMAAKMSASAEADRERLMECVLIVGPEDCEIVDGRIVIRKSVVARGSYDAIRKFGVEVR